MNKQVVFDPTLFPPAKSCRTASCTDSSGGSSHATSNLQGANSVKAQYLYPLIEAKASKTSEGSNSCIRSFDDSKYNGLLPDKGSILANAANAARNSENQVCLNSEECWDVHAAGLTDGQGVCRNCLSPIRKRCRVV